MSRAGKGRASSGQLRIIGGQWRGRRLRFRAAPGLRPTTDRVRETLFNWLATDTDGARCLDLFAGSGALGLEALSRGAAHCDFVDSAGRSLEDIAGHLAGLGATARAHCHAMPARRFLAAHTGPWDIVFLDPPFGEALLGPAVETLADLLHAGALVYIETGQRESLPTLPPHWELYRDKTAGDVRYRLFVVGPRQTV
jgi:16S rRNA (guanine966-N2)-methyltransferase